MAVYPCEFDRPFTGNQWLEYYAPHRVFHPGWDLNKGVGNADIGNEVRSPTKGKVVYTSPEPNVLNGQNGGLGYFVVIYHEEHNVWTRYAHLRGYIVHEGQELAEGQLIGYVGKSGTVYGHLHFEVWKPSMFMIQANHWRKFCFYPTGKSKKFVMDNYIDGLAWIDSLNVKPDYRVDLENWASQYIENLPLLLKGDVHSMIALIRAAVTNNKRNP